MNILLLAGVCAATFSATVLGLIQVARWVKWRQKPDWIPTLTYTVAAIIMWKASTL